MTSLPPTVIICNSRKGNKYLYDGITNKIYRIQNSEKLFSLSKNLSSFLSSDKFELLPHDFSDKQTLGNFSESSIAISGNLLLVIEITQNCNLRCKYCAYSGKYFYERKHCNKSINPTIIEKVIKIFKNMAKSSQIIGITFYGGEPLLKKDLLIKTIKILKQEIDSNKLWVNIVTNGTLLDPMFFGKIKQLCEENFFFSISIDGPAEIHDRYRRTKNDEATHQLIIENLSRIRSLIGRKFSNHFKFLCTLHPPFDLFSLDSFFDQQLFSDCNLKVTHLNIFDTTLRDELKYDCYIPIFKSQYKKLSQKYIDDLVNNKQPSLFSRALFENYIRKIHNRLMNPPIRNIHAGTCKLGQRLFCDSEGILYPCEKANSKSLKIGDYNNGISYNNIDYIEKQWVDLLKFECSKCFAVRLCSLCYVHAIKANNFDINKMRINCANEKKSIDVVPSFS